MEGLAFGDLLAKLQSEHDRLQGELQELREENRRLRTSSSVGDQDQETKLVGHWDVALATKGNEEHASGNADARSVRELVSTGGGAEACAQSSGDEEESITVSNLASIVTAITIETTRVGDTTASDALSSKFSARTALTEALPEMYPELQFETVTSRKVTLNRKELRQNTRIMMEYAKAHRSGDIMIAQSSFFRHIIMHPHAPQRTAWDVLSVAVVGYDIIFIPLEIVGFDLANLQSFVDTMDWITASFWTVDIGMSFLTGYNKEGVLEMRPIKIARSYLRSWALFDFSIVATDWAFLIDGLGKNAILRIGKSTRATRIIRTLRLVRSVKLHFKMMQVLEAVRSEAVKIMLNLFTLATFILIVNHYVACGWFWIGSAGKKDDNWIDKYVADDMPESFKYTTALHWSLTQFTPAAMEVHPNNALERIYAIVILFFAMITFSTFVSSITTQMTMLRRMKSEPAKQQKVMQDYFMENRISADLGHRIWSYLQTNHYAFKKRVRKSDIAVFKLLPVSILTRLHEELYVPALKECPFFYRYGIMQHSALVHLCNTAISESAYQSGEEVFNEGKLAEYMYFLTAGHMKYTHRDCRLNAELETGRWASEPALWIRWSHYGKMEAVTFIEVQSLSLDKFRAVIMGHRNSLSFVRTYAKLFVDYMKTRAPWDSWWTDVWINVRALADLARKAKSMTLPEEEISTSIGQRLSSSLRISGSSNDTPSHNASFTDYFFGRS